MAPLPYIILLCVVSCVVAVSTSLIMRAIGYADQATIGAAVAAAASSGVMVSAWIARGAAEDEDDETEAVGD